MPQYARKKPSRQPGKARLGTQFTPIRQVLFWLHLVTGASTGVIIGAMSLTGVVLAFERHVMTWAERTMRTVPLPATGTLRMDLDALVAKAYTQVPEGQPSAVVLQADPAAAILVNFGREQVVFVDPYTGVVLGKGAQAWRGFFHLVTDWHRWLGMEGDSRATGRAITGACNTTFVAMVITGIYLWRPRRWTRQALKAVIVPTLARQGKARDWNWHHVAGFWSAPILLCITLTGVVMSYEWANHLLYTLTGSMPPSRPPRIAAGGPMATGHRQAGPGPRAVDVPADNGSGGSSRDAGGHTTAQQALTRGAGDADPAPSHASLEALFASAAQQAPHWRSLIMRLPPAGATQMVIILEEAETLHPSPRSLLTLDTRTAGVVQWEPFRHGNLGRTLRAWVRPVHTGEAGGLLGQVIAAVAAAAGVLLVWTGLALTWRRFLARQARVRQQAPAPPQP